MASANYGCSGGQRSGSWGWPNQVDDGRALTWLSMGTGGLGDGEASALGQHLQVESLVGRCYDGRN